MSTNQNKYQKNSYFMRLALQQARRSLGNTRENPAVGCVIAKNNHLISAGSTSIGGRPHAEQNAINFSEINLQNSQLYVTLEPCSHYGKTAPCVKSIIKNKIKKVFFSINDPDPRSFNKSAQNLRRRGIYVSSNIYDVMGRKIKSFVNSIQDAGYRSIHWNAMSDLGQPVSGGMYIYTIQAGEFRQTNKMVLLK